MNHIIDLKIRYAIANLLKLFLENVAKQKWMVIPNPLYTLEEKLPRKKMMHLGFLSLPVMVVATASLVSLLWQNYTLHKGALWTLSTCISPEIC